MKGLKKKTWRVPKASHIGIEETECWAIFFPTCCTPRPIPSPTCRPEATPAATSMQKPMPSPTSELFNCS